MSTSREAMSMVLLRVRVAQVRVRVVRTREELVALVAARHVVMLEHHQ